MTFLNRRNFLKASVTGVAGLTVARCSNTKEKEDSTKIRGFRTLGRTGFRVSDISVGAGMLNNANVLASALDAGINYIDTAEHYMNGQSEIAVGEVIQNRDRKSVFITTKLNLNFGGPADKANLKERFGKCLERLKTDYADCLMMHMAATPEQVKHEDFHAVVEELKAEGRVRFVGLSNHGPEQRIYGNLEVPMEKVMNAAVEDGRFDVALFVYNFLQKEQGEKIIAACKTKDIGVTLMKTNPVNVFNRWKAGLERAQEAGRELPERIFKMRDEYEAWLKEAEAFKQKHNLVTDNDVRDAATKFCLSHPDVHTVCPSINTFDELEAFVAVSGTTLETADASMLQDYEHGLGRYYCRHACGSCETACPQNVPVNTIMRYTHYFEAQGREKHALSKYYNLDGKNAEGCETCEGLCESACPHGVPVQSLLVNAHRSLRLV